MRVVRWLLSASPLTENPHVCAALASVNSWIVWRDWPVTTVRDGLFLGLACYCWYQCGLMTRQQKD